MATLLGLESLFLEETQERTRRHATLAEGGPSTGTVSLRRELPALGRSLRAQGGYLLHVDGTLTEGSPVVFVAWDEWSGLVLDARVLSTENHEEIAEFFRTLKTFVEVEPVRHRRERRVRAYLFVCLLAVRLEMALRRRLTEGGVKEEVAEYQERLLTELSRVERTQVQLGGQLRQWYLNVTNHVRDGLKRLKLTEILVESPPSVTPAATVSERV